MEFTATRTKLFITNNTKTIQIQIHTKKTRAAIHRNMKEIIYNKQHSNSIHKKKRKNNNNNKQGNEKNACACDDITNSSNTGVRIVVGGDISRIGRCEMNKMSQQVEVPFVQTFSAHGHGLFLSLYHTHTHTLTKQPNALYNNTRKQIQNS